MGVGALVWVGVVAVRRVRGRRDRLGLVGMTVVTALAVVVGLELLGVLLG